MWVLGIELMCGRGKVEGASGWVRSGWVGNGYSVGNVLSRCKGVRGFRDALDASWLRMEPEGLGLARGAQGWF